MSAVEGTMKTESAPGARLAGLDGLRGLAMLGVIFCHLQVFNLGWTGLSSFFVLSGFLITRILLGDRERAEGLGDYFKRFYVRRTLRVFPIYYAYLAAVGLSSLFVPALAKVQGDLPAAFLYVYNFQAIAGSEHSRMLNHLWSLSVEEQFYLVWPWVIVLLPRKYLAHLCIALIAVGPLIREALVSFVLPLFGDNRDVYPIYAYLNTASHLDAFAFGALINLVNWRPRAWHLALTLIAAFAVGLAINGSFGMSRLAFGWPLFMPYGHQYAWGYTVVNFFWFMTICAILSGGWTKRFFSLPLLDYLGKRSYSTYIIHFPVLGAMNTWWQSSVQANGVFAGTALFAVPYLAVVFTLSGLSYRFIELPFNNLRDRFGARSKSAAALAGDAVPTPAPTAALSSSDYARFRA